MSIQFSDEGPIFPDQLVDALLAGDVVFLCGAGVSAPQLPSFEGLVRQCFERLNMGMSASEEQSFQEKRYEEVLGSLSRRTVDPVHVTRTVVELLKTPKSSDLNHHHTILRLSRNLDNKPVIITTNFDTMLEQALSDVEPTDRVRALSFAGQDLPSPGSASFGGIIHLHGRIADEHIQLEETPLVVTSADYGDAYMRSGWASRFLFDLCRCKTVVLIGYSAGDAPVRYFLNVLEADRQRFPDLQPVYALDSVTTRDHPDVRWGAVAVVPLVFELIADRETGARNDYSALWRDLAQLADLVERPRVTRRSWTQKILTKALSESSQAERERVLWLLRGSRDLWSIVISSIEDPEWFQFFVDHNVWGQDDVAWVLAAWLARDFQSVERFAIAMEWRGKLDQAFSDAITNRLRHSSELPKLWVRAWQLLALSNGRSESDSEVRAYTIEERLRDTGVLSADIQSAVEMLTPRFKLTSGSRHKANPVQLNDLFWARWVVVDQYGATQLVKALVDVQQPVAVMEIATAQLQKVVRTMIDLDEITDVFDRSDSSVPSVEPHEQNEHHEGPVFLVQLLAGLLPEIVRVDTAVGRSIVDTWRRMPGFLGARLWLHALRSPELFTAAEAFEGLLSLPLHVFWHIRRELALVLRERAADADQILVARVEQRILTEGEAYYQRYTIDPGQVDWRSQACDAEVWLRLQMLASANRLTTVGSLALAEIKRRREHLDREVEERDFFSSYSFGVRTVVGDAQPILEAPDGERLTIALDFIQNPDIRIQMGWGAYCGTDPQGAFDTLSRAPRDVSNAPLWKGLIEALSYPQGERDAALSQLVVSIFETLRSASDSFLTLIINSLTSLYLSAPRRAAPEIVDWWPRLLPIALAHDARPIDAKSDLFQDAINTSSGRLTEALLTDIDQRRKIGEVIGADFLGLLSQVATAPGLQGTYARAILVRDAPFVLSIDGQTVSGVLDRALSETTAEAAALRAVLVHWTHLSSTVSSAFSRHILLGVTESESKGASASAAAAKIIAPALAIFRQQDDYDSWGITIEEVARALRQGAPTLRMGAIDVLSRWIGEVGNGPAEAWRTSISPLLDRIWPRDRELCDKELTPLFTQLAVASKEAFPDALDQLLPYLTRMEKHGSLYAVTQSRVPEEFPLETLTLLWRLCGPGSDGGFYGVTQILERIIKAQPKTELDRRLQWLDQRAVRSE